MKSNKSFPPLAGVGWGRFYFGGVVVEKVICGKDCTFSAFVVEAVRIMLENLEEDERS